MTPQHWIQHFEANRQGRPEPDWGAPITVAPAAREKLTRSIEQFQLGDGGGPACLIAWNAEGFRGQSPEMRALVDAWFAEEKEHSRLLLCVVKRFGGTPIQGHWSFSCFLLCRRWLGVRFELTVLLLTEIASTGYYRLIQRHCADRALRQTATLILRDEAGHILFHCDRLVTEGRAFAPARAAWFRALGHLAATMLWVNHGPALVAIGASRNEFYGEVRRELTRFLTRHRMALQARRAVPPAAPPGPVEQA